MTKVSRHRRGLTATLVGAGLLVLMVPFAVMSGHPFLSPAQLWTSLSSTSPTATVIWEFRLPRVLLSVLVGMGLSASGVGLQAFFRNPLADPFILGIASGGALGSAIAFFLNLGPGSVPLWAFVGALGTAYAVYRLGMVQGMLRTETVLLAGVALNALLSSLLALVLYLNSHRLMIGAVYAWLLGGFQMSTWRDLKFFLPYWLIGLLVTAYFWRALNALLFGEEWAHYSGVDIGKVRRWILAAASLCAGAAVSVSGIIGFVGLIAPHFARLLIGPDHRWLLPAATLFAALLLLICDMMSRLILHPTELPIGLFTALLGVPFFLLLLRRTKIAFG
ncbi:MAG: iron ABC transporter permease [Armatimonadetes bacterium]|nr:iron ABC transporter permease [Armatimonadota bacterium]MDW8122213.1 iron ABC transporter permease [Armatimonadota bacterium]